mmetsp:Transcript_29994/g.42546  ORF Transcript_29994/g.42546 Transcript_29994/m.42546 type:complete len:291 (+) Transcript_29994:69-941(+)|eukprot:CAMPEP_0202457324 /NCGR_PEP_ID=MMETSP1360-20130828/14373_1 /ASSEMBLY_ACC=CAM_ASM_000848 /TAXON_ID=515479 /ORGANISM="Licmophora paradoxa, Strain CCMP2313" /LENGTH=290 /DNA_ID=CAMNT_0049077375 /DNA_START=38 /DNA_END=910 /DNA_ORIENTATION=+
MNRIFILLLLPLFTWAENVSLRIPKLKLALVVDDNDGGLDLHQFQSDFEDELVNYLEGYVLTSLPNKLPVTISFSTRIERHYYGVLNLQDMVKKARITLDFDDGKMFMENSDQHISEDSLEALIRSAITGAAYWSFMQRLINSKPPLNQVEDLQVTEFGSIGASLDPLEQGILSTTPSSLMIILCVFSSILLLATLALSLFSFNKWRSLSKNQGNDCKDSNSSTSSSESGESKEEQRVIATKRGRKQKVMHTRSVLPLDAIEEVDDAMSSSICSREDISQYDLDNIEGVV